MGGRSSGLLDRAEAPDRGGRDAGPVCNPVPAPDQGWNRYYWWHHLSGWLLQDDRRRMPGRSALRQPAWRRCLQPQEILFGRGLHPYPCRFGDISSGQMVGFCHRYAESPT